MNNTDQSYFLVEGPFINLPTVYTLLYSRSVPNTTVWALGQCGLFMSLKYCYISICASCATVACKFQKGYLLLSRHGLVFPP